MIVDVDDATTQALGYPYSRKIYANLLEILSRGGARWVVFDFVFDTRRRNQDGSPLYPGEDDAFAAALERHPNTTLAGQIPSSETDVGGVRMRTLESSLSIVPLPEFLRHTPRWGAVQTKTETDGIARRYVGAWRELDGTLRHSLATRPLIDLGLADSARFADESPWNDPRGFRIRFFGGAGSFPTHSFLSVIDDSAFETPSERDWGEHLDLADSLILAGAFRGKIVLVGSSAMLNQDLVQTAISRTKSFPGVELHAHAMGTWMLRSSLRDIPSWIWWAALLMLSWGALAWGRRIESWWLLPLPGSLIAASWTGGVFALAAWDRWAGSFTTGALAGALCILTGGLERYVSELARKREITRTFGQYVSPEVVKIMTTDPSKFHLGGQRGEISVLFSDFQGFTRLSEILPPEQFVPQIGECFSVLSEHILEQRGTLDKYMGDAIMAEFGMPLPLEDKALRACRAAWRMQAALAQLRSDWASQGMPALHMRVGIATGIALFGNMGSRQKFDYTALGDTINLGSRLEGVNKTYGTEILLEGTTRTQAGPAIRARLLDRIRVVGKSQAVPVWQLVHVEGEIQPPLFPDASLAVWEAARKAWDVADFGAARAHLEEFSSLHSDDLPARILQERIGVLEWDGTPQDWDGSVSLDHK